jgi:hypothetical protein
VPSGWTCEAYRYNDEYYTCGCGITEKACPKALTIADCYNAGCQKGFGPDPNDPTQCIALPAGWTCTWWNYRNSRCECGCGLPDPICPTPMHMSRCKYDRCPSGLSPDPLDVTSCIKNAPQDTWTCDKTLIFDGKTCDCGCGGLDPDCAAAKSAADCDVNHCKGNYQLVAGSLSKCEEKCQPPSGKVGSATCQNGGHVGIGSSCVRNLYRCSDGNRYEVECTAGDCICRVNRACTKRFKGSCSFSSCGWSLVDAT